MSEECLWKMKDDTGAVEPVSRSFVQPCAVRSQSVDFFSLLKGQQSRYVANGKRTAKAYACDAARRRRREALVGLDGWMQSPRTRAFFDGRPGFYRTLYREQVYVFVLRCKQKAVRVRCRFCFFIFLVFCLFENRFETDPMTVNDAGAWRRRAQFWPRPTRRTRARWTLCVPQNTLYCTGSQKTLRCMVLFFHCFRDMVVLSFLSADFLARNPL